LPSSCLRRKRKKKKKIYKRNGIYVIVNYFKESKL
jgi:hypothetical protein